MRKYAWLIPPAATLVLGSLRVAGVSIPWWAIAIPGFLTLLEAGLIALIFWSLSQWGKRTLKLRGDE